MEDTTRILARFVSELTYDKIPVKTREWVKEVLLDTLACALAGYQSEETPGVAAFASALAQSKEASIIGGDHLSLAGAVLLNGYLTTAVTMCDVYRPSFTHITPEVVSPTLGIAERDAASGRELLLSLAAGMEVMARIGLSINFPAFRSRGWHGPGVIGPFGSAAAVGRLIGLNPDRQAAAFGLAGSQSGGTFAAWGTPTVKFHQCRAALAGVMAALLAEQDFVATKEFLTAADGGLYTTFTDGGRPELATAELGERWELEQIALRLWPANSSLQTVITAVFDLMGKYQVTALNTKHVLVTLSEQIAKHDKFRHYKGKFEAMLSAHYLVAAILHDHELTLDQFEPARYDDPILKTFAADRVTVAADPGFKGIEAAVQLETTDGRVLHSRCAIPKGAPENPLTRTEIEQKFRHYARGVISPEAAETVIRTVNNLEELKSARTLMDYLRA